MNDQQAQPDKPLPNPWAKWALICFLIAIPGSFVHPPVTIFFYLSLMNLILVFFEMILPAASILLACFGLCRIAKTVVPVRGLFLCSIAIAGSSMFLIRPTAAPTVEPQIEARLKRIHCERNLNVIGIVLTRYAAENQSRLPRSSDWADQLRKCEVPDITFPGTNMLKPWDFECLGSGRKEGKYSYALNQAIAGRKLSAIAPETVLLFEVDARWNSSGGPEMFIEGNHIPPGGHVLLASCEVKFVTKKEALQLRWEP